jgi:hypothetical protein
MTRICSVFGQIEGVVADAMVEEGKARYIPPEQIPISARYNDAGERAICALVFPSPGVEAEFDFRVEELRA